MPGCKQTKYIQHSPVTFTFLAVRFAGLKARVLSAWQPQSNAHEFAMFLEDDVEVGPAALSILLRLNYFAAPSR